MMQYLRDVVINQEKPNSKRIFRNKNQRVYPLNKIKKSHTCEEGVAHLRISV